MCGAEEFTCPVGQPKCISSTRICDGYSHCADGMDESKCGEPSLIILLHISNLNGHLYQVPVVVNSPHLVDY